MFVVICKLFSKLTFSKNLFRGHYQSVKQFKKWIKIKTNILFILNWVQTVCKGYPQTSKITTSKERVNLHMGLDATKSVFGVSDKASFKPVSSAIETS